MVQRAGGDRSRVVPAHEMKMPQRFPSRLNAFGLQIVELACGDATLVK